MNGPPANALIGFPREFKAGLALPRAALTRG